MPPISLTVSMRACSVNKPSSMLLASAPMASMGLIRLPVASAAFTTSGAYWLITSRRPAISPVVHVTPSSISVLVSPIMFKNRARKAVAASVPLLWVTAVMVPRAAVNSLMPTWAWFAMGEILPRPSAMFSTLVAYLFPISLAPSSTAVSLEMLPSY